MKRIFTTSIYCLLFLLFGVSFGATAHKALDKPNNELPNFVSPHLFDAFSKKLKAPLRTDENIITWSDAISKGLPVLKIGGVGMSYNDFLKKGGTDSVKIEEGGVDCIRYRITKVQDSVAIGEEFELTVTAEYIDNIPFMWQNKECGDFCIKVFMPEGFVQTGGDYRDFEGFSLRPDGLKRIERKIKGYFESKPQNNCFMLTKGAKYYDPKYLLEVKQNYCWELVKREQLLSINNKENIENKNQIILSDNLDKKSIIPQNSVPTDCATLSFHKPQIVGPGTDFCVQNRTVNLSTSCPSNSTAHWYTNNYNVLQEVGTGDNIIASSDNQVKGSIYVICKDNSGCCFSKISSIVKARTTPLRPNSLSSIKQNNIRAFFNPESANELVIRTFNGTAFANYEADNVPVPIPPAIGSSYVAHYQQACYSGEDTEPRFYRNDSNISSDGFRFTISTTNNLINYGETTTLKADNCVGVVEWYKDGEKLAQTSKTIDVSKGSYYSKCKYTNVPNRIEDKSEPLVVTYFETAITPITTISKTTSNCQITLTASCNNGGTFSNWQTPNNNTLTSNPIILNSQSTIGDYIANCSSTCGTSNSKVTIDVLPSGTPYNINLSNNAECNVNPKEIGNTISLVLSSNDINLSTSTIIWTKPDGTTVIGGTTLNIPNAQLIDNGTYSVTVTKAGSSCESKASTCVQIVTNQCIAESNVTFTLNNSSGSTYFANNGEELKFVLNNVPPSYNTAWYRITGSNPVNISTNTTEYSAQYSSANGTQIYKVDITKSGCATITKQIEVKYKDCAVIAEFWDNTTTSSIYKGSNGSVVVGSNINFTASSLPNATYSWNGPNNIINLAQQSGAINNITTNSTGLYTVTVSNVAGCGIITATMYITVPCFDPVAGQAKVYNSGSDVGRNVVVNAGDNVSLFAPDIAGASYQWTGPNGFNKYERNPSISGYITQAMAGTYNLTVSKNGCSQTDQVTITVGCAALNNVNAYTNSPNCEVKTGETLSLWVDKGGANYTYNWTGPANFQSTWQTTGKNNVTDNYSGLYTVVVGYVGCTQTVTRQVNVCIFKCDITVDTLNVVCNPASGSITSFKVKPNSNTLGRTISYKIEIKKYDAQGNSYYEGVNTYPDWVQPKPEDNGIYKFDNVPSGVYRIWVKEQKLGEVGGLGRVCDGPPRIVEIKCDPCSYVQIDAVPSAQLVPAPVISSITLTANYYNTPPAPINVNSISNFNWTGPNGYSKNTQSVPVYIPGNYIVNYTANYNSAYTKACTAIKNITMPPCIAPGVIVKGYTTTCEGGVNYVQLMTEGDFSNVEFSVDMVSWSTSPKLVLTGPMNGNYKVFARSTDFRTCIFELATITKTCDCASQPNAVLSFSNDCTLSSNILTLTGDFGPSIIEEYKIKNANGSYESAWTTDNIFTNITAGSYYIYARKQGVATCYIQSMIEVQAKQPESPVSYPCDINKSISIGETSSSINVKTQKSWSGNALKLDGIKDFGETPPLTDLNGTAFTFETWALPDPNASITLYSNTPSANPTNQRYLMQGKANGTRAFLSVSVGDNGVNIIEETTPSSKRVVISKAINITTWTHIAVTYQTNTYTLFVNGSNQGTFSTTNAANGVDPPSIIGGSSGSFYKGKIDETRWWNNAKSETDIKANMSVALATPFAAELKRYYRYDQVSGKTIPNAVTAGTNDITLKNECNAFVDNTVAATGLELYPLFTWSTGSTGRELTISTPTITTCYTVTMKSPTGVTCSSQICIPIENCTDINVTVTPSATVQENTGVRPLLSANIPNPAVLPEVSVNLENSLQFSGNDIVNVGNYIYMGSSQTIEFWAKPNATTKVNDFTYDYEANNRNLIRPGWTGDGNKAGFGLTLGTNGLAFYEGGTSYNSVRLRYTANFTDWNHFALVYDQGKPRLYVNGELVYSSNTPCPKSINGISELGRDSNLGYIGLIDELRIWDNARSAQEIKDNFDKAVVATYPNKGYWRFNRSSGKVIDTPSKIVKDESPEQNVLTLNSASVTTTTSTGTAKVNPKITWWLEKKNPTTGEITEEQVGIGSEYRMPLDLIKQGTYNYTVKFVKNDNTICKKTKTITVTANTDPVTCFTIMSDQNMNLISGNTGSALKQTLNGITNDRIWKRTYRASDNSYYVFSSFNGAVWQNNNPANNVTLVDGNPTNSNHRWRFEDLGGGRFMVRSLADENHVLYMPDGGGDQRAIVSGFPWWNWSQYAFKVQAITCPVIDEVENCVAEGRISYQRWDNIGGGTQISDLNAAINTTPTVDDYITSLEKQGWGADNYGTRIRGYVCPPITGYYTFWVAGDDNVELWLSTDDKLGGKQRIAYHNEWSGTREYTKFGSQQSAPIPLRKGKKYYIEVLHKEGGGGDGVSVRWQTPYTEMMEPIPGTFLAPYQACNSFTVKSTPADEEILVDTKITMEVTNAAGVSGDKLYSWSVHQGGTAANLIDANGNSVTTLDGYTAWAKPSDEGEMIYKVVDKADPTCYQFIKKKVKAILCGCPDCGEDGKKIATQNPEVTASFSATGYNYVVSNSYIESGDGAPVIQSISYFDGIGRPLQSIVRGTGINGEDIVQPYVYDGFGRTKMSYLPYPEAGTGGNFVENATGKSTAKYSSVYGDGNSVAEVEYENSPISRVLRQGSIGAGWGVNSTKATKFTYRLNTTADAVKKLTYNFGTDATPLNYDVQEVVIGATNHEANTLSVTITKDENDNESIVFKNMEGQVVLTRSKYPARNGDAEVVQNTYYVYDDFGQVRCVIPPKAEGLLSGNFKPFELAGTGFKYKLIFAFDYDIRGRVSKKKSADVDVLEEMLYNTRDELELVKTRSGKWMRMTYDDLGRNVATFLYTGAGTPTLGSSASMDKLTENFYDNYAYSGVIGYRQENEFPTTYNTNPKGKLTGTWVKYIGDGVNATYNYRPGSDYYDEYGRLIQASSRNHVGGTDYLLYKLDFTGRVVRNLLIANNVKEISRVEKTYSYNRSGKVNSVCQRTGIMSDLSATGDAKAYWEPVARYAYNVMGDLKSNTMGCKLQVVDYAYNIKGWLTKINSINGLESGKDFFAMQLGYGGYPDNGTVTEQKWQVAQRKGKNTDPFALKQGKVYTDTYAYRNDYQLKSSVLAEDGNPIYSMNGLNYDIQGNIQHLSRTWRGTLVDDLNYAYFDNSNQLKNVGESPSGQRLNPTGYEFFDESKTPVGNTNDSYAYDASGNMTKDLNKGINTGEIVYNFLNLPDKLKGNSYIYTADGDMVQMRTGNGKFDYIGGVVYKNDAIEQVPTANGRALKPEAIKQNNSNPYVATPDTLNKNYWRYEYQLTDHLGNMRVACRCQEVPETEQTRYEKGYPPRVVQQAHYDPWGVKLPLYGDPDPYAGKPAERFLYNGKEYENVLDLYNFGARMYDPTLGRWFVPDPIDQFSDFSPYGFVLNDPMNLIDPDGNSVTDWYRPSSGGKGLIWQPTSASNITVGGVSYSNVGKSFWGPDPNGIESWGLFNSQGNFQTYSLSQFNAWNPAFSFNPSSTISAYKPTGWENTREYLNSGSNKTNIFAALLRGGMDLVELGKKTFTRSDMRGSELNSNEHRDAVVHSVLMATGPLLGEAGVMAEEVETISSPLTGNPAAIASGYGELNTLQASVLNRLPEFGSQAIIPKGSFSLKDLSALTARTGDEFAMFTNGGGRLIIRGGPTTVPVTKDLAKQLASQGWRFSAHTHPDNVLRSSFGDRTILSIFKNENSTILDTKGRHTIFTSEGDW